MYSTNMLVVAAFGKCLPSQLMMLWILSSEMIFGWRPKLYMPHYVGYTQGGNTNSIPVCMCVCVYVYAPAPPCDITPLGEGEEAPRGTRPWSAQWAGQPAVMTHAANKYTSCKEGLMKESQRPEAVCPRRSSVVPPPWLIHVPHTGPSTSAWARLCANDVKVNAPLLYVIAWNIVSDMFQLELDNGLPH